MSVREDRGPGHTRGAGKECEEVRGGVAVWSPGGRGGRTGVGVLGPAGLGHEHLRFRVLLCAGTRLLGCQGPAVVGPGQLGWRCVGWASRVLAPPLFL